MTGADSRTHSRRERLTRRLVRYLNTRGKAPTVMSEARITFPDAGSADRAEQILRRDAVAITRDETLVVAVFEQPWQDMTSFEEDGRRLRQILNGASLQIEDLQLRSGTSRDERTIHRLAPSTSTFPTDEQRPILRVAPHRLMTPQTPRLPAEEGLEWTDTPDLLRLPWALVALIVLSLAMLTTLMVTLSGTREWWNPPALVPTLLAVAVGILWVCQGHGAWSIARRALATLAIITVCYAAGILQAHTTPTPLGWREFVVAVAAGLGYIACVWLLTSSLDRTRSLWRQAGGAILAIAATAGVVKELVDMPRRLLQEGLGVTQTPLSITPYQAITTIDRTVLGGCAAVLFLYWLMAVLMRAYLPARFFPYIAPWLVTLAILTVTLAIYPVYGVGDGLRRGALIEEGEVSSCVSLLTGGTVGASPTWSTPRVLVGSSTGPSAVLDPSRLDEPSYVRVARPAESQPTVLTGGVTIRSLPPGACATHPFESIRP